MPTDHLVPADAAGQRLDLWLTSVLDGCTRSHVGRLIKEGWCELRNPRGQVLAVKAGYTLVGGESVSVEIPDDEPLEAAPEDLPLTILHEDEHLIVLDKAAGMVVHPSIGHLRGTLANGLLGRYGTHLPSGEGWRPGIVHRLDAETSGVIVVARTDQALVALQRAFHDRVTRKTYLALVAGHPRADFLECTGWIGRHAKDFRKRAVREPGEGDSKECATTVVVHERRTGYSVVECRPKTGRTHQIRVHLAHQGHPVLADALYGRSRTWPLNVTDATPRVIRRHALHAWVLELPHPATGATMRFQAPIPADLSPWMQGGIAPKQR